jgi:hypothetical protein
VGPGCSGPQQLEGITEWGQLFHVSWKDFFLPYKRTFAKALVINLKKRFSIVAFVDVHGWWNRSIP